MTDPSFETRPALVAWVRQRLNEGERDQVFRVVEEHRHLPFERWVRGPTEEEKAA